ncbi:centromere protein C isoform X2 [Petromyzon marinus]|uniref:Centromere protein C n=1 Tax=Petromyzon marinus TaxID=7757 RepID=A0AAJ7X9Z4_PETMA|nr:centromere protein C isoform X2 [Petromyzon marinus]
MSRPQSMQRSLCPNILFGRRTGRQLNINVWDGAATINDYFADFPEDSGDESSFIPEIGSENRTNVYKSPASHGDLRKSLHRYDPRRSHMPVDVHRSYLEGDAHRSQAPADACESQILANARRSLGLADSVKRPSTDNVHRTLVRREESFGQSLKQQGEEHLEKQAFVNRLKLDEIETLDEEHDAVPTRHSAVPDKTGSTCKLLSKVLNKVTPRVTTELDRGQNPTGSLSRVYQMPSPHSVLKGVVSKKRLIFDDVEGCEKLTVAAPPHGVNPLKTTPLKPTVSRVSSVAPRPSISSSKYLAILEADDDFCDDFEVMDDDMSSEGWLSLPHSKRTKNAKEVRPAKENNVRNREVKRNKSVNTDTRAATGPSALAVTATGSKKVAIARIATPSGEGKKASKKDSVAPASNVTTKSLSKSQAVEAEETENTRHLRSSRLVKSRPSTFQPPRIASVADKTTAHASSSLKVQHASASCRAADKSNPKSTNKRQADLEDDEKPEEEELQEEEQENDSASESSPSEVKGGRPVQASRRFAEQNKYTDSQDEDDRGGNITGKALPSKKKISQKEAMGPTNAVSKPKQKPNALREEVEVNHSKMTLGRRVSKPPGNWWIVTDIDPSTVPNYDHSGRQAAVATPRKPLSHSQKKSTSSCPSNSPPSPLLSPASRSPSPSPPEKDAKSAKPNRPTKKQKRESHGREEAPIPVYTPKSILKQGSHHVRKSQRETVNFVSSHKQWDVHMQGNQEMGGNEGGSTSSQSPTPPPRKSTFGTSLPMLAQKGHRSVFSTFSEVYMDTPNSASKKDRSQQKQSRVLTPRSELKRPSAVNHAASVPDSARQKTPLQLQHPPGLSGHMPASHSKWRQQPEPMVTDTDSSLQQSGNDSAEVHLSQNKLPQSSIHESVKKALHQQRRSGVLFKDRPEATQGSRGRKTQKPSPFPEVYRESYDNGTDYDDDSDYQEPSTATTNSTVGTTQSENASQEEPSEVDATPLENHNIYDNKPSSKHHGTHYSEESMQDDSMEGVQCPKKQHLHKKIRLPTNTPGMRRSERTRVPTLKFWAGERIKYRLRRSGGFLVSGIISPEQVNPHRAHRKSMKTNIRRPKNPRITPFSVSSDHNANLPVNLSIQTEDIPEEMELADVNEGTPVQGLNENEEFVMDCVRTQDMCAYLGPHRQALQPTDALGVWKALSQPSYACGYFILRPQQEKGLQYVNMDTMLFNIIQGKVAITIHNSNYILQTGDMFVVPPGNVYNVRNLRYDQASLFFTQIKGNPQKSVAVSSQPPGKEQQHHYCASPHK